MIDMGCGAGATPRTLVGDDAALYAITMTNVALQNRIAARLDAAAGVADRMAHLEADYTRTGLPASQADDAWALESACYAEGTDKAARRLKPGARLAVVNGFLLRHRPGRLANWLQRLWADSWAMPTLAVRDGQWYAMDCTVDLTLHGRILFFYQGDASHTTAWKPGSKALWSAMRSAQTGTRMGKSLLTSRWSPGSSSVAPLPCYGGLPRGGGEPKITVREFGDHRNRSTNWPER